MKRFKKYLIEMEAQDAGGSSPSSTAGSPPDYIRPPYINPTWPMPSSMEPIGQEERPRGENEPPDPIDWGELDDRIQSMIEQFQSILRMMGIMSWNSFLQWLWSNYGIDLSNYDSLSALNYFTDRYRRELGDWFNRYYPNATQGQTSTFQAQQNILDDRLRQLWELHVDPNNPYQRPLGGADDDRYRPLDIDDPNQGPLYDTNDPVWLPWWYRPPNPNDGPLPGTYQA